MMRFVTPRIDGAEQVAAPRILIGTDGIDAYAAGTNDGSKEARHVPGHVECDT